MELTIKPYEAPQPIEFNFEELKAEITERTEQYKTLVYTEDNIKDAKADRATLNKLAKSLNDERISREKAYMMPFNEFKAQVNELISIVNGTVLVIDNQIKEYEDGKKEEKKQQIITFFNENNEFEWLKIGFLWSDKWINASTSLKSVEGEILAKFEEIKNNLKVLEALPQYGFECVEFYKQDLDMQKALSKSNELAEMAKRKEELEKQRAEAERLAAEAEARRIKEENDRKGLIRCQLEEEARQAAIPRRWIGFEALLSEEEAHELALFLRGKNIQYRKPQI